MQIHVAEFFIGRIVLCLMALS